MVTSEYRGLCGGVVRMTPCSNTPTPQAVSVAQDQERARWQGCLLSLETVYVKLPREGNGNGDVNTGVFKKTPRLFAEVVFNLSSWCQQAVGRKIFSRWVKIQARCPASRAFYVFFLTSRERYVPSAEPATRRLSSGRCPKANPSSVSHNPRRAVMGHPSTSYSATQVQRERKGQKGMFITPPEYDDIQSRAVVTQWTSSGPVVFSVLLELTPDFHKKG